MGMLFIGLSFLLLLQFRIVFKKGAREMNTNELADALQETEPYYSADYKLFDKAATMLRQQQAEIEELKAKLQLHEAMDNQCASLMQQFRKA